MSCQSLSCDTDQLPNFQHRSVHFTSESERKSIDFGINFRRDDASQPGGNTAWNSSWSRTMSRSAPATCPVQNSSAGRSDDAHSSARFPRLEECAHFHYGRVQLGGLRVVPIQNDLQSTHQQDQDDAGWVTIIVRPHCDDGGQSKNSDVVRDQLSSHDQDLNCPEWIVTRSAENFKMLDSMLHRCIYDRKVSGLPDLSSEINEEYLADKSSYYSLISDYLHHFSIIADDTINCGPILNWFQMDNKGHKLLVASEDCNSINTPAVAAAYSVRRYVSQARDEISFEVGDMISVIDMPGPSESTWWRGKRGFKVGFFPQECVAVIGDKVPRNMKQPPPIVGSVAVTPIKPVLRKHGKLISLFRSFILSRPSRRSLRQQGILRERVFGCDLGEHLLNSGHDVPLVLSWCANIIEEHGRVDGIYRLSGAATATHRLRLAFDEERPPMTPPSPLDVHAVASLLKMYFRELPNPLCTYQLYSCFVSAVKANEVGDGVEKRKLDDSEKLIKMRETVVKLPPPHYRTLAFLMRHLHTMSLLSNSTGMTAKNMGIVWAPNLLRSPHQEFSLSGVAIQVVVTEFLICYADIIFSDDQQIQDSSIPYDKNCSLDSLDSNISTLAKRPKSLPIATPTKLLSLEEARNKQQLHPSIPKEPHYIEVGGGPNSLPRYHTIIQLPSGSTKRGLKRSPSGWRGLFFRANKHRSMPASSSAHPTISDPIKIETDKPTHQIANEEEAVKVPEVEEKMTIDTEEAISTRSCESLGSEGDSLPPLLVRPERNSTSSHHNRSASCDSYFEASLAELAGMRLRLSSQEREMDIFSEDDTTKQGWTKENSSGDTTAEPSPINNPTVVATDVSNEKKTTYEEDLLFIDCSTPEHTAILANRSKPQEDKVSINQSQNEECCDTDEPKTMNDQSLSSLKVKLRERASPRRNDKVQFTRHSHCGLSPAVSSIQSLPQRHSTLIQVDWLDSATSQNNPKLCGYSQLQSDSDTSIQIRESKDSQLNKLIESKESLDSRNTDDNLCLVTWSLPHLDSEININDNLLPNQSKCADDVSTPCDPVEIMTQSDIVSDVSSKGDYEDVSNVPLISTDPKKNEMVTSSESEIFNDELNSSKKYDTETKCSIAVTSSDENFSSHMVDSLEGSLSPCNISYQNLNRLSMLSEESSKISVSKESTPTCSPPERERNDEVYECYSFTKPSYINLPSSSGGSTPTSPKNKSPLKSTICVTYKSPVNESPVSVKDVYDKGCVLNRIYENVDEDKIVVPNSSDASLPNQVANDQSLILNPVDSTVNKAMDVNYDDIYNKVKVFRQSIHEVNSIIMEPEYDTKIVTDIENVDSGVSCTKATYENVEFSEPQVEPSYENVEIEPQKENPGAISNDACISPLIELRGEKKVLEENVRSNHSYENFSFQPNVQFLKPVDPPAMKLNSYESDKENSDENENLSSSIGDCFVSKRSSVKQLAHKFESPTENNRVLSYFDKLSKSNSSSDKNSMEALKGTKYCELRDKANIGKTIPCFRGRNHRLAKHSNNARSLDENAFIKEFENQPIHKDHISDVEIRDYKVAANNRNSLETIKNFPRKLPDLNLNIECNTVCLSRPDLSLNFDNLSNDSLESNADASLKFVNRHISITPTTENKICLVQARLSPKKGKQKLSTGKGDIHSSANELAETKLSDGSSDSESKDKLSRERIEKYKEERRLFLREKYSSQSFRGIEDIQLSVKNKRDKDYEEVSFDEKNSRECALLERRNTADAVQRSKFSVARPGLQTKLKIVDSVSKKDTSQLAEPFAKKIEDLKEETSDRKDIKRSVQVPDKIFSSAGSCESTSSGCDKRSPSFSIKDMTAMFEQKSAANSQNQ